MGEFKGKKIAVLGRGIEGESSAEFLKKKGASVTILDEKEDKDYLNDLNHFDLIVRSPGIKLDAVQNSKFKIQSSKVTSQTRIFFDLCPCPIIGVTGTKGKGTTSSLIYEMLKADGKGVYLGGNIGVAPLSFLEKLKPDSIVVLELSSFQLQDLTKSPHVAVMLMTTQEHLAPDRVEGSDQNFHTDIEDYISSKRNIFKFQTASDFAILNRDYPASRESDVHTQGKVFYVSFHDEVGEGCVVENGKIVLKKDGKATEIIDVEEILLPGRHNLENVCAAVMAATLAGVSKKSIVKVLKTFKGLEHRLELVGNVKGVRYYDDSFSTTPETAIAAIEAFSDPEILILGGASKGSKFTELGKVISEAKNIKAIIGIGIEWPKIKSEILNSKSEIAIIEGAKDMETIVKAASKIAEFGDVVLLSPACSSFDMFENYKVRGEKFKREVFSLSK